MNIFDLIVSHLRIIANGNAQPDSTKEQGIDSLLDENAALTDPYRTSDYVDVKEELDELMRTNPQAYQAIKSEFQQRLREEQEGYRIDIPGKLVFFGAAKNRDSNQLILREYEWNKFVMGGGGYTLASLPDLYDAFKRIYLAVGFHDRYDAISYMTQSIMGNTILTSTRTRSWGDDNFTITHPLLDDPLESASSNFEVVRSVKDEVDKEAFYKELFGTTDSLKDIEMIFRYMFQKDLEVIMDRPFLIPGTLNAALMFNDEKIEVYRSCQTTGCFGIRTVL